MSDLSYINMKLRRVSAPYKIRSGKIIKTYVCEDVHLSEMEIIQLIRQLI